MNKKKYESPVMTEVLVELEQGFLSASITDDPDKPMGVVAGHHEIGAEFDYSETNEWDEPIN